jgi:hypothetical protein
VTAADRIARLLHQILVWRPKIGGDAMRAEQDGGNVAQRETDEIGVERAQVARLIVSLITASSSLASDYDPDGQTVEIVSGASSK